MENSSSLCKNNVSALVKHTHALIFKLIDPSLFLLQPPDFHMKQWLESGSLKICECQSCVFAQLLASGVHTGTTGAEGTTGTTDNNANQVRTQTQEAGNHCTYNLSLLTEQI